MKDGNIVIPSSFDVIRWDIIANKNALSVDVVPTSVAFVLSQPNQGPIDAPKYKQGDAQ